MTYDSNNIFARILRGEIPCETVYEDQYVLAFNDIAPQASIHILVIPKGAYSSLDDFSANASSTEIAGFHRAVAKICEDFKLPQNGFRAIANTGDYGGREVPHFHLHLLGGEPLGAMLVKAA